ncbi:MAG: FAD-dependent oxidoreductase [Bryobacterales bacterium]
MNRRAALSLLAGAACSTGGPKPFDICVYGGTSGGVAAAVQAARMGKTVLLVEPGKHLGGMTSGGLSAVDIGNPRTVGGIAREYFTRLAGQYGRTLAWDKPLEGVPTGGAFAVEPHAAEALFRDFVREANAPVLYEAPLEAAHKQGARITAIEAGGHTIEARMFIDATYEGDLMAAAGVRYTLMREANSQYGETLNGVMFNPRYEAKVVWGAAGPNGRRPDGKGLWDRDIPLDPYVRPGDPSSGVLPLIDAEPAGEPGSEAPGVQAYCFRLCMTREESNRIPLEKPGDYDANRYEIAARFIAACVRAGDDMDLRWFSKYDALPGGKFDFNTATFGANLPGASWAWPEASWDKRRSILAAHESYHRGLLWFLATDERSCRRRFVMSSARSACAETNSRTPMAGHTKSTSEKRGAWSATRC